MSATAEQTTLHRLRESIWGTVPAPYTGATTTRFTGEGLTDTLTTETSQEIRADRSPADLIVVDASAGGNIDFELSYSTYDDLFEDAFMGTWTSLDLTTAITTLAAATDNVTATGNAFSNIPIGASFRLEGGSPVGIDTVYTVVDKADDNTLTVIPQPLAGSATDLVGSILTNGTTKRSYSILKTFTDASPAAYQMYNGMRVTGFSLDMSTGSIMSGSFNFLGSEADWLSGNPVVSALSASTTPVMNAVDNITTITLDGTNVCSNGSVSNLAIEWDNSYREQKGLCRLGSVGVVPGVLSVSISASLYFQNDVEAKKAKASQDFPFVIGMTDQDGNMYVWNFPRCKYADYTANATGLGSDVMGEATITPLTDPVTGKVCLLSRIPAP
jgi:hypothetical protein